VTFSGVSAPRLSFKKETPDEPFAWAAREHLRAACIGKVVSFSFSANNQPGGRQYGTASLADGQDLRAMMVSAGYLAVRGAKEGSNASYVPLVFVCLSWCNNTRPHTTSPSAGVHSGSEETQMLEVLEQQAQQDKVGRYTEDAAAKASAVRDVKFQGSYDAEALFASIKNTPQQGTQRCNRRPRSPRAAFLPPA
jgi:endonuclease YncB( thermonuclease family)